MNRSRQITFVVGAVAASVVVAGLAVRFPVISITTTTTHTIADVRTRPEYWIREIAAEELVEKLQSGEWSAKRKITEGGETLLHLAAASRGVDILEILVAHGADINARDDQGRTPRSIAKLYGRTTSIEWFRERYLLLKQH